METIFNHFKSKFLLSCLLFVILICSAEIKNVNAQVITVTPCVPPLGTEYSAQYHQTYSGGGNVYDLSDVIHTGFNPCVIIDTSFVNFPHTFNSTVSGKMSINGGFPIPTGNIPCVCTVLMTYTGTIGNTKHFVTEMTQLDLTGGGFTFRESPSQSSTGLTTVETIGGGSSYIITSFFDVFTELSTDAGTTWFPSTGPGHVVLRPGSAAIPTLSQWGLIILGLSILAIGMVVVRKKELAVAGFENAETSNYFLFDKRIYVRVLSITLILVAVGLIFSRFYYGTLSLTDIFGAVVSAFIVSYTIHIFIGHKKK